MAGSAHPAGTPLNWSSTLHPAGETAISAYNDPKKLLQMGYQSYTASSQEGQLCQKLNQTVEAIKAFVWQYFHEARVGQDKMPPFLIHLPEKNAYYSPQFKDFAFHDLLAATPEVVAHEYTHALLHNLNDFPYQGESGALDESFADVVAIVFKRSTSMASDWKIGGLRDLSIPKTMNDNFNNDLKPRFNKKNESTNDMGYVHQNGQIISHAFYLAATTLGQHDANHKILSTIWMESMKQLETKTFNGFVTKTLEISYKHGSIVQGAIKKAWRQVGLLTKR